MAKKRLSLITTTDNRRSRTQDPLAGIRLEPDRRASNRAFMEWFVKMYGDSLDELARH